MGMSLLWGLASGPECFVELASFLGLASGPVSLIFRSLSVVPQPLCTVYVGRAVTCFASGAFSTCLLGAGLVRAWLPSFIL